MTTLAWAPNPVTPWSAQVTLDGQLYTVATPWSLYGQRYYVYVFDLQGNLVLALPRVEGPNLAAGYFTTSTLNWSDENQTFTVTP